MLLKADSRMEADTLKQLIVDALEDMKAEETVVLDIWDKTTIATYMIIASGRSDRHVRSIADQVVERVRDARMGRVSEERDRDWVLLDAGDVVVHVMLPETRQSYALEKLWSLPPAEARASAN